jgi:hypothetical protein
MKKMLLFKNLFLNSYVCMSFKRFKTKSSALVVNLSSSYSEICGTNPGLEAVVLNNDFRAFP